MITDDVRDILRRWDDTWPGAVSMFKQRYDTRYCSHGYPRPLDKAAQAEHRKRRKEAKAELEAAQYRYDSLFCGAKRRKK